MLNLLSCLFAYFADNLEFWDQFILVAGSIANHFFYTQLDNAFSLGVTSSTSNDLFIVNTIALIGTSLWRRLWIVYLSIPAYILYLIGGYFWSWMDKKDAPAEEAELDPKTAKKLEKQKKNQEKPRVKYVKG